MTRPQVLVCAGGGGVGKTTTSAAIALAVARTGQRVLIVSLDPARRLADALGVEVGTRARELSVDAGDGALLGLMPDPHDSLGTFASLLFESEPDALQRLRENKVYRALEAAVPGIHELASIGLTHDAVVEHAVDVVVIDTAPSRNAIDFIGQPKRLAKLLGGRAVGWLASIGKHARSPQTEGNMGRIERLLVRVVGPAITDVAALFVELAKVRQRFLWLNDRTGELLLRPDTQYFLVAAPTTAARDDAMYLVRKLREMQVEPRGVILNSAYTPKRDWLEQLDQSDETTDAIREALALLREEAELRERAATSVATTLARRHPRLTQLRLPFVDAGEPRDVVTALSSALDLPSLIGPSLRSVPG